MRIINKKSLHFSFFRFYCVIQIFSAVNVIFSMVGLCKNLQGTRQMCFHKTHLNGLWGCKIPVWPLEMITHTHILEMCFLFRFGFLLCAPLALLNYANGLQPKSIKRLPSEFRQRRMLLWWAAKPCPYNLYASTYMPLHV